MSQDVLMQRDRGESTERKLAQRQMQFQIRVASVHQRLYCFVRRALGNPQDAEDVTQEALARAWSHFEAFDPQRPFEAWLFRIANNLIIDQSRRRRRRQEVSLDSPAAYLSGQDDLSFLELSDCRGDPQQRLMAKELSGKLQFALHSLPPIYQEALLLVAQKYSYEEIARRLNCPLGTVRSRVSRARIMIQRKLKESKIHA